MVPVRVSRSMSDYGLQLREKQKLRRIYGVLEKTVQKLLPAKLHV